VKSLMAGSIVILFSSFASGQAGVDAKNVTPEATCEAVQADAALHKAPIQIAVESASTSAVANGEVEVVFRITNLGKEVLILPNLAQSSVQDEAATTSGPAAKCLMFAMGPVEAIAGKHLTINATLTGRPDIQGSLKTIAPGESIQVQTVFKFPPALLTDQSRMYVAVAKLWDAAAQTADGQPTPVAYGTGFAISGVFTLQFPAPTAK
jgi:hypothetical protein